MKKPLDAQEEHKKVLKLRRENKMLNELITALGREKVSLQELVKAHQETIHDLHQRVYRRPY